MSKFYFHLSSMIHFQNLDKRFIYEKIQPSTEFFYKRSVKFYVQWGSKTFPIDFLKNEKNGENFYSEESFKHLSYTLGNLQTTFWTKLAVRGVLFRGLTVLHFEEYRLTAKFSRKFVNSSLTLCDSLFKNRENFNFHSERKKSGKFLPWGKF